MNYTGATYTFQKVNDTTWKINRTGGQAADSNNFLPGDNQPITGLGGGKLSSASGTSLLFAKGDNPVEVGPVDYYSSAVLSGYLMTPTQPTLRIDNLRPSSDGPNNNQTLTVVVFDQASNVREVDLNVNVLAASAADQEALVVN